RLHGDGAGLRLLLDPLALRRQLGVEAAGRVVGRALVGGVLAREDGVRLERAGDRRALVCTSLGCRRPPSPAAALAAAGLVAPVPLAVRDEHVVPTQLARAPRPRGRRAFAPAAVR